MAAEMLFSRRERRLQRCFNEAAANGRGNVRVGRVEAPVTIAVLQ